MRKWNLIQNISKYCELKNVGLVAKFLPESGLSISARIFPKFNIFYFAKLNFNSKYLEILQFVKNFCILAILPIFDSIDSCCQIGQENSFRGCTHRHTDTQTHTHRQMDKASVYMLPPTSATSPGGATLHILAGSPPDGATLHFLAG